MAITFPGHWSPSRFAPADRDRLLGADLKVTYSQNVAFGGEGGPDAHITSRDVDPVQFTIFFAWQSDRPGGINRWFLDEALRSAAAELEKEVGFELQAIIDRDTMGVPGSPEIAATILEKIRSCDVLVADVTLVHDEGVQPKRTPNPNVLLELGYAAGSLGWEHVVLVVNQAFGPVEELPFDLRGRRALPYSLAAEDERKPVRRDVASRLKDALRLILEYRLRGAELPEDATPEVLIEPIRDRTEQETARPASNLNRLNRVLEWHLSDDELPWTQDLLEKLRTRLARIPPESRQLYRIILDRAEVRWMGGRPQVALSEIRQVIGRPAALQDHLHILENHRFVHVWFDEEKRTEFIEVQKDENWPDMLDEVSAFCARAQIPLDDVLVKLDFSLLDEERPTAGDAPRKTGGAEG